MKNKGLIMQICGIVASVFLLASAVVYSTNPFGNRGYEIPPLRDISELNEVFAHLSQEDFLYDFEYLIYVLNNNFSHTIILEERGFNINQMAENTMEILLANDYIDVEYFWDDVLFYDFLEEVWGIGHLSKFGQQRYRNVISVLLNPDGSVPLNRVYIEPLISNPNTLLFYGDFLSLNQNQIMQIRDTNPQITDPNNLTTEILEEGRIAHIQISRMSQTISGADRHIVRTFYSQIEDFEHLIIDIRGNSGGWPSYFFELIMAPLLDSHLSHRFIYFHKGGEHVRNRLRGIQRTPAGIDRIIGSTALDPSQGTSFTMPESNHWAIEYFDYFRSQTLQVWPSQSPIGNFDFNGEIWLLVDNYVFSASQMVTSFVYETGFATIVGETTGGIIGGPTNAIYFSLPNTGIIIGFDYGLMLDSNGRPLENGTIPHIYSDDALNTVLELIEEE